MSQSPEELAEYTAGVHALIPVFAAMGLEVVEAGGGRAAARIPVEPNRNHFGVIYAGSLFSVAEMLGGIIGMTALDLDGFVPIVKRLEITFSRPATSTVTAATSLSQSDIDRVRAEAQETGKSEYVLTCDVTDEDGTVVASTSGTYQLRRF